MARSVCYSHLNLTSDPLSDRLYDLMWFYAACGGILGSLNLARLGT